MAISYAPIFINDYLRERLDSLLGPPDVKFDVPLFPTSPSTIDQLTQGGFPPPNQAGLFGVYDRMFKMRRRKLPHIKDEQLLYYFYSLEVEPMVYAVQHAADLLDRGDESAQDLNSWIQGKLENGIYIKEDSDGAKEFLPVHFHDIRIWQLEETRDIIDFGTARTYAGNKIIVDYSYHTTGYPKGTPVENFDPARPRYRGASNESYNGTAI